MEDECDCCGYTNPPDGLKEYPQNFNKSTKRFCHLCANTMTSVMDSNPLCYRDRPVDAMKAICWGINYLLAEMRK